MNRYRFESSLKYVFGNEYFPWKTRPLVAANFRLQSVFDGLQDQFRGEKETLVMMTYVKRSIYV